MTEDTQPPDQHGGTHPVSATGSRFLARVARFLEAHSISLTPEQLGLMEGLRAATAVVTLVAAAWVLDFPLLSWAAIAAFWTFLADPGGADRTRLTVMGGFAISGTIITVVASSAAHLGLPVAATAIFALVFLCSLSRALGTDGIQPGILASVVAVVAVSYPNEPLQAVELSAIFLGGSLWAMILCLLVWRIHPHAPIRRSVVAVYERLLDMASDMRRSLCARQAVHAIGDNLKADHQRSIRNAIERTYALMARLPDKHDAERNALSAALDLADQMFAALIAIEHHACRAHQTDTDDAQRLLDRIVVLLSEFRRQSARKAPDGRSVAAIAAIGANGASSDPLLAKISARCTAASVAAARRWTPVTESDIPNTAAASPGPRPMRYSLAPAVVHHALRTAIAVGAAFVIAEQLDLAYSYWATMAAVVVMQPGTSATWWRSAERMVGSIVGGAAAAASLVMFHIPGALLLIIFPAAAATIALRSVSYTLYVAFLTPLFIFMSELLHPGHGVAWARALDNIVGAMIGIGVSSIWSTRLKDEMDVALKGAVTANLDYVRLATSGDHAGESDVVMALRMAGVASTAAEINCRRLSLEGRRYRAQLDEVQCVLWSLRELAGAATVLWFEGEPTCSVDERQLIADIYRLLHAPAACTTHPVSDIVADGEDRGASKLTQCLSALSLTLVCYMAAKYQFLSPRNRLTPYDAASSLRQKRNAGS
ncbi:FUSC family protein [Rhizobium sp. CCGE 510]|uniref:FUSC family protein n=1 Tax=Rhizobium sp. CCGE 510 TaxID=1132836 RepID=UPI00178C1E4D|nr:FUSC family protein [Rhizobium sp. CCGE 510]